MHCITLINAFAYKWLIYVVKLRRGYLIDVIPVMFIMECCFNELFDAETASDVNLGS